MLTGDKVETATCIAISAGFKNRRQQFYFMKELRTQKEAELKIKEFEHKSQNHILMIDGHTLDLFMRSP
jgi:phospholipid-translocating ATPase